MKAIIVPGVTDLNKGDQSLVWESHRLVKDTALFKEIFILNSGDSEYERKLLCEQSLENDYEMIENILKHPRRGNHKQDEHIQESSIQLLKQVKNAGLDFISTKFLLTICNNLPAVKLLFSQKVYNTVKEFSEADAVFVKGGGFIHAYGEKTAPYLMWYFLFYVRLAQKLGKKVIFLPNSFGPFNGLTVENQIKSVFSKMDLIYAREKVSADALSHLLNKHVPVEFDLGFFLEKGDIDKSISILSKYNLKTSEKIIGITVRPWRFPGSENPKKLYDNYLDSVASFIEYASDKGYKIALCNQSLGRSAHEDDRIAISELLLRIKNKESVIWIDENLSCDLLKAVYSHFHFFIGTRFHSIIFSLTSLVPSIAIGYGGNKAEGIMNDFNLNDYIVQIQDIEKNHLISMFENGIRDYNLIQQNLHASLTKVSKSRNRLIKDIKSLY